MIITYFGTQSFKVQFGETILAFDPVSKKSKFPQGRFGADIVLITIADPDMNGVDNVTYGEKRPFVIEGPGEYEIKDVFIKGFSSKSLYNATKGEKRLNTIYSVALENMNLAFLGAISETELSAEAKESVSEADVLFIPIGGGGVLDASSAYKCAVRLEPKIIIPMHYGSSLGKDALTVFLKEAGEKPTPLDKLTLKRKDLEGKEGDIVVLRADA